MVSSRSNFAGSLDFTDMMWTKHYNRYLAYCRSKLANLMFARELAKRVLGTGVTVCALHPGAVNTDLYLPLLTGWMTILRVSQGVLFCNMNHTPCTLLPLFIDAAWCCEDVDLHNACMHTRNPFSAELLEITFHFFLPPMAPSLLPSSQPLAYSTTYLMSKTPKQGAQTSIHCAVAKEVEGTSGKYWDNCAIKEPTARAKDDQACRQLWEYSAKAVGLHQ